MKAALHYYRALASACTVTKATGGTVVLPAGWYSLTTVLAALRAGSVTCSWDSLTNVLTTTPAISIDQATIRSLLGWPAGSADTNTAAPGSTWVPEDPEFLQELGPCQRAGKPSYDTDFYMSQSGQVHALGSVQNEREVLDFNLVYKQDVVTIPGDPGLSAPFLDAVYRPDLGIVFELKTGETDVDCEAGYTAGADWAHTAEPVSAITQPPWDLYYSIKLEVAKYVGS